MALWVSAIHKRRPARLSRPTAGMAAVAAIAAALFTLIPNPAFSGPPPGTGSGTGPEDEVRRAREPLRPGLLPVMKGETHLTGTVLDRERRPLPGIRVKLIVNGMVIHTAFTDAVGQYDFKQAINYTGHETVTLWFVDASHELSPKALVLAESESCRTNKLLSPCYSRVLFEPVVDTKVYLFDRQTRSRQLVDQGCI